MVDSLDVQSKDGDIFTFLTLLPFNQLYLLKILFFAVHEYLFIVDLIVVLNFFLGSSSRVEEIEIQRYLFSVMEVHSVFLARSVLFDGLQSLLNFKLTLIHILIIIRFIKLFIGKIEIYLVID